MHTQHTHRPPTYQAPGRMTGVFNQVVAWLARRGVSVLGSRELHVRGRSTGAVRTTPVNLLTIDGRRYIVAPRGQTQWVRNIRVAGGGELRLGRRVESFRAVEVADADKPAILRPYLRRWKFEVGVFFDGIDASASEETLLRIAPRYPVFRVVPGTAATPHADTPHSHTAHVGTPQAGTTPGAPVGGRGPQAAAS